MRNFVLLPGSKPARALAVCKRWTVSAIERETGKMRHISSREPRPQGLEGVLSPRVRALRACEKLIRDLQAVRPSRDPGDLLRRRTQLRTQANTALRLARSCVMAGDFRQAGAADLAGMMNSFSKMCTFPVAHELDAIVGCIGQEVAQRAVEGSLVCWSPRQLALVANGFG